MILLSWGKFAWRNKLSLQILLVCVYTVELAVLPVSCWGEDLTVSLSLQLHDLVLVESKPEGNPCSPLCTKHRLCIHLFYYTDAKLSQQCLTVSACIQLYTHTRSVWFITNKDRDYLWLVYSFPSFPFYTCIPAVSVYNLFCRALCRIQKYYSSHFGK